MPVTFHIFPERGLVYVRYQGHARIEEGFAAFADYARHPDCRPGQKQLVDLSEVTSFDRDFVQLMQLQARKAEVFMAEGAQTLIVYHAPDPTNYGLARQITQSWEPFPSVVAMVQQDEADALALLGQPETSFGELLQRAS